jgi:hypothetical protein
MVRLFLLGAVLATVGCFRQARLHDRETTGTCEGACAHYVDCKGLTETDEVFAACVTECRQIYEDSQVLASYERLRCADAIAFIEGPSQRGPGAVSAP